MSVKTFKEILEKERHKVKPLKRWFSFVTGRDVPHKSKKIYDRKRKVSYGQE